jgi:hypothetical protein
MLNALGECDGGGAIQQCLTKPPSRARSPLVARRFDGGAAGWMTAVAARVAVMRRERNFILTVVVL